jgi:hypothetical protein
MEASETNRIKKLISDIVILHNKTRPGKTLNVIETMESFVLDPETNKLIFPNPSNAAASLFKQIYCAKRLDNNFMISDVFYTGLSKDRDGASLCALNETQGFRANADEMIDALNRNKMPYTHRVFQINSTTSGSHYVSIFAEKIEGEIIFHYFDPISSINYKGYKKELDEFNKLQSDSKISYIAHTELNIQTRGEDYCAEYSILFIYLSELKYLISNPTTPKVEPSQNLFFKKLLSPESLSDFISELKEKSPYEMLHALKENNKRIGSQLRDKNILATIESISKDSLIEAYTIILEDLKDNTLFPEITEEDQFLLICALSASVTAFALHSLALGAAGSGMTAFTIQRIAGNFPSYSEIMDNAIKEIELAYNPTKKDTVEQTGPKISAV